MMLVMRQLEQSYPWSNSGLTATVTSLYQYRYGSTQTILLALFGAVGCVLLIGCVNVANLLLAQGSSRKKSSLFGPRSVQIDGGSCVSW
jgi:putative ABC transport system permease protein